MRSGSSSNQKGKIGASCDSMIIGRQGSGGSYVRQGRATLGEGLAGVRDGDGIDL